MIRINLLPQRRARVRSGPSQESTRPLIIGIASLAAAAVLVAVVVDRPKRSRLAELTEANHELGRHIAAKTRPLTGYAELKRAAEEAAERYKAIQKLIGAKVVPAYVLHELGEI